MTKLHVVGSSCLFPRLFLVVGLVCLVVVGSSLATSRKLTTQHHQEEEEEGLHHNNGQVVFSAARDNKQLDDFNYMSKRRVPNGPDPIHNRRAGNSGRPPGQA
ncbi:hypothetical protein HN51_069434 [Arachis hypogaea]|uniref:CLAVATA3/ESR (CLE)-related protein n=1 Tax=Arachis hypogaea TaxID=3818 RepID=A0A444Z669_ARAHY|nr:CLAVATA3/ESR (CLE)-related protein [Arachis hypogaea]RYR09665.1 hypothetical protein Ahy_B05g078049 [Arachis hypogaea]